MNKKNLQDKVQRLSNELEELRLEREESKKNVMHFIEEADVARQELEKAQATIAHLTQQLNGGLATPPPTDKLARLLAKVHSLDDTDPLMDKLLNVLEGGDNDNNEIRHYQQQLQTAQRDHDQQMQYLHQAQERISQLEREKQQINDMVATANRDKAQLEERVTRLEEDQKHMADALDTANTEKMMAQTALERVQEERQRMDDALSATNTAKTTAQETVAGLEAELKRLTDALAVAKADKDKMQHDINTIQEQLSTVKDDYATEHDRAETLEQRWQSSEGELEQAEARVSRLEQEITTLRQQQWEAKVPAATQKAEWESRIDELQSKYDQAQQQYNQSKADLAAMATDLTAWKEKHQQLSESMTRYKQLQDQQQALEQARIRENHLKTINKTLRDEIRKASSRDDSAVNIEYLRNVIIKFLEKKQTRAQLVPVLSTLLQCSQEDQSRLSNLVRHPSRNSL
ncbi:predicted protein [Lichtheimia corymbifera JMRC:FSU:9682]|uniref:GRIP domain-containing protein n=1 Tax=Lichtheimia corymbifera JMRC:FSU:9682 TaxID=1263082 RepID=A0A068RGT7_9FUNG|nr:predicted protein [Lichtheimia corymbifera JMRC:FSU:9682]